jgi:hypothetical protein
LSQNYIGFENTICKDYISEKLADRYEENHNAIAIYRGARIVKELFHQIHLKDLHEEEIKGTFY